MAPSKMRRALWAVKDRTSIGLAKVGNSASLSDLDVAIVKATRHEEYPADEKHIREILSLTYYSRAYINACVDTLSRRLNRTKNWTVALKTLILIQRLLAEGDPAYEQEIFFATRRGTRFLNMSDFRDSRSNSWDYSAFVRTFALYLDQSLEFRMQGRRRKHGAFGIEEDEMEAGPASVRSTPVRDMKMDHIFSRILHLQQLLERFLACRPTGGARHNRVVITALYPIVKESIQLYNDMTEILGILFDRFMELEIPESVKVYEIFCRVAKQIDELDNFYRLCKTVGIARTSEYPDIEKITQKQLDLMEEFIQDKSSLEKNKRATSMEPKNETDVETKPSEDDMYAIKAPPPPENHKKSHVEEVQEEAKDEDRKEINTQQEADLLNLHDDALSTEEHADKLALALFNGGAPAGPAQAPAWEAFNDDTTNWETALVQSTSNLTNQKTTLGGGLDMMLLDGMFEHEVKTAAMSATGFGVHGSASSVALDSAGRPTMLALPAPPVPNSSATLSANPDPFSTSLAVAPPTYVQMSELEKKQKLLVEEQLLWQQYAKDGMQGQVAFAKLQPNYYNVGGYTHGYYPRSG